MTTRSTLTLEDLFRLLLVAIDAQDTTAAAAHAAYTVERAYNLRRAAKVKEIEDYIVDYMNEPQFAAAIAESIMMSAEDNDRISGDTISGTLAAKHARGYTPNAFTI